MLSNNKSSEKRTAQLFLVPCVHHHARGVARGDAAETLRDGLALHAVFIPKQIILVTYKDDRERVFGEEHATSAKLATILSYKI